MNSTTNPTATYTELAVRRPNGQVETVRVEMAYNDAMFAKAQVATRAAGRGEVLSYTIARSPAQTRVALVSALDRALDAEREEMARAMATSRGTVSHARVAAATAALAAFDAANPEIAVEAKAAAIVEVDENN